MKLFDTAGGERRGGVYILAVLLLVIGVTAGSVYLVNHSTDIGDAVKTYIENLLKTFTEDKNSLHVFKNSLISSVICLLIIFFMGFFRFGFLATGFIIVRKGFITGFTAASLVKFYGLKGMLVMLASTPTMLITLPALLFFSAISVKSSVNKEKIEKNFIFSYIFLLIIMISIFCAASLCEGYLTTTFMKWLSPIIT